MHIQINTDTNSAEHEELGIHVKGMVESVLDRFSDRITRVEVRLSDQDHDPRVPDNKHCVMEARLQGRQPTAVSHQAACLREAVAGAADKLKRTLEGTLGRLRDDRRM